MGDQEKPPALAVGSNHFQATPVAGRVSRRAASSFSDGSALLRARRLVLHG